MGTGRLGIRLFGEFAVELDGRELAVPAGRPRELLAWFALAPGAHARGRVAGTFWPAAPEQAARASLRSAVWSLRRALGDAADAHLIADRSGVGLSPDLLTVDVMEFGRLAASGRAAEAVALCRGELLHSFDQDWAALAREEHQVRLSAQLGKVALLAWQDGQRDAALDAAGRRLALQPCDEDAAEAFMGLLGALARRLHAVSTSAATSTATVPHPQPPSQVLGRSREVAALDAAWHAAAGGRGSVVVLAGDGGMGKTLLATELRRRVEQAGALALTGYPDSWPEGAPFALWSDVFSQLSETHGTESLAREIPSHTEPRAERVRQLERGTQLLLRAARAGPMLLVLEDVHRADPSSLDLLAYAGRRLAGQAPCLVVLTRRRLAGRGHLDAVLAALNASGSVGGELELGPLPGELLRQLVLRHTDLTESQAARIAHFADGNPLLALEAARTAAIRADLPTGLRCAVRAALGRLSPHARRVAEYLAVAGRPLRAPELAALPLRDAHAATDEALTCGLLQSLPNAGLGFRHALVREACYADLAPTDRAALHEDLAAALAGSADSAPAIGPAAVARHAAELGHHLKLAGRPEAAAVHYAEAAAAARAACALPEAAHLLAEALALTPGTPALLLDLAEIEARRGRQAQSDAAFARAMGMIGAAGD